MRPEPTLRDDARPTNDVGDGEFHGVQSLPDDRPALTLNLQRFERHGGLLPTHNRTRMAEQYRLIKRTLLGNARAESTDAQRLSSILVTSALPGEGKTLTAINLAMSLSTEIDTAVLLVDADVIKPDVMKRLGVQSGTGLMDLLTDPGLRLGDVVRQTNVAKLRLLAAGKSHSMASELLASEAMETLLDTLLAQYPDTLIIFDGPPLLVSTEAKVLAALVGQVVVVVEAERTPRSAVKQAFEAVEQCPVVLSMLNKARLIAIRGDGYGYGYGRDATG